MARRVSVRRIKSHRSYTIKEAATCTGVTPQTVRRWAREGLRLMAAQRPILILGADLKDFISTKRSPSLGPMPKGQFYCLGCKERGPPAFGLIEYRAISGKHGMIHAFCGSCEGPVTRIVSRSDLTVWATTCEVVGNACEQA